VRRLTPATSRRRRYRRRHQGTPESVIAEAKSSGKTIIDVASAHKMLAVRNLHGPAYLDYTDDPSKEAA
jgi:hypothetical protein